MSDTERIEMMTTETAKYATKKTLVDLLDDIDRFIRQYVIVSDHEYSILALWVVHVFVIDAFDKTPYLAVTSASKACGKTRVLEVLELVIDANTQERCWFTASATKAVLVRKIDALSPVLLLDETDGAFKGNPEYAETLRSVLNAGYSRGGTSSLCVGPKNDWKDFQVFCPKAFAGIGRDNLPDTVMDRSIPITMKKKRRDEAVSKFKQREVLPLAIPLQKRLVKWATPDQIDVLRGARPTFPPHISDRAEEISEPLLAIANLANDEWATKARQAVGALLRKIGDETSDISEQLLHDIHAVWPPDTPFIASMDLIYKLSALVERPWATISRGGTITPHKMAHLLKEFRIISRSNSGHVRGYDRERFTDAWGRYGVGE